MVTVRRRNDYGIELYTTNERYRFFTRVMLLHRRVMPSCVVRLSVCLSVTSMCPNRISWANSNFITRFISPDYPIFARTMSAI